MKKIIVNAFILMLTSKSLLAQFTQGNLVAYQVGDGTAALTSAAAPTFLKEYTTAGVAGTTVAMPTTGAARLTTSGSASSEGLITRSSNGQYIVIPGYDATSGTASIKSTTSASTARVIDTVNFNGIVGRAASTNSFYSADNFRSATADGNTNFWGGGPTSGTTYMGSGTAAALISPVPNTRYINIFFNHQLYYSTGSGTTGIYKTGMGTPSTAGQTSTLVLATTSSPYGFAFDPTGDTCYVADDGAGITKYAFNGTSWSTVYLLTNTKAVGLVVDFSVYPNIIYATTSGSSANKIIKIIDAGAASVPTTVATAPTNTAFRGLAFSPYCAPVTLSPLTNVPACIGTPLNLLSNSFGADPIEYTWTGAGSFNSTSIASPLITNAASGVYTVSATNSCGAATATINVTVNQPPTVTANTTNTLVCSGSPITLTGAGATTYSWTGGVTDGSAYSPTVTATYTVTGIDNNNCSNTATVTVNVNSLPPISISATNTTLCIGNQTTLSGNGASTYTWSGAVVDGVAFTPTTTATYTVSGTDNNNCVNTATVSVTVNQLPTVSANTTNTAVCTGSQVTLSGAGAATYTWSGGVTDGLAFAPSLSSYTVTGTDNNNCVNTATINITINQLPNVTANTTNTVVCDGSQITLTGGGASTYTWSGGVTDGLAFAPSLSSYTVTGTDNNNCTNTAIINISINQLPNVSANTTNTAVCTGNQITLSGAGASTYTWSGGVTDGLAFAPSLSSYTVTGTDNNNCVNTATINITINQLPTVSANATNTVVCKGSQVTLTGGGAATYTWSNGVSDGLAFTPTVNVTYTVSGTDNNTCTNTATVSVNINQLPTVTANTTNTVICSGNQVTLTGGGASTYTWSGGVTDGTAFTPTLTVTYTVTGADVNGCVNQDTITVVVNTCSTGIEKNPTSGITLFPNPNNGSFTIQSPSLPAEILLYDVTGKLVLRQSMKQAEEKIELQLENGMYLFQVLTNENNYNSHILIQN